MKIISFGQHQKLKAMEEIFRLKTQFEKKEKAKANLSNKNILERLLILEKKVEEIIKKLDDK